MAGVGDLTHHAYVKTPKGWVRGAVRLEDPGPRDPGGAAAWGGSPGPPPHTSLGHACPVVVPGLCPVPTHPRSSKCHAPPSPAGLWQTKRTRGGVPGTSDFTANGQKHKWQPGLSNGI